MEEKKDEKDSALNEGEAEVSISHAMRLVQSAVRASDIGIITPYTAQLVFLKKLRSNDDKLQDVEISTVDGFQGGTSEGPKENVSVTHARKQCCLVCITETVTNDKFLKRLIGYFEEHGEYLSASEYGNKWIENVH